MKKLIRLFFCVSLLFNCITKINAQNKQEVLSNQTIIKLVKSKVGDELIINKINNSNCDFNIGTDALILLKENNVPEKVINVMVEKQTKLDTETARSKAKNSDGNGNMFKSSGIYFQKDNKYVPLDPTLVTSTKSSGGCGCLYTYGLVANKSKSQIEGKEANYQFNNNPTFYFNFLPSNKSLNQSTSSDNYMESILNMYGHGNQEAISPNEFKLIKLDVKGNRREYVSGSSRVKIFSVNPIQNDFSIDDKYIVNFKYSKISDNTFKIEFPEGLNPGEYCFFYLSNSAKGSNPYVQSSNNIKVFDFSIK